MTMSNISTSGGLKQVNNSSSLLHLMCDHTHTRATSLMPVKNSMHHFLFFFGEGGRVTPCKAEQPLRGMELQEKEAQEN